MGNDFSTLDSAFAPLSIDTTTLDSGFDATGTISDGVPATTATSPDFSPLNVVDGSGSNYAAAPASSTSQANPTSQVSGFNTVLNTLTGFFSSGVAAYNSVAATAGLPTYGVKAAAHAPTPAATPVFLGLTQNQLYLIGGGVAVVALLLLIKRK